jgi:hypothetical protein
MRGIALATAVVAVVFTLFGHPARGDGLPPPPPPSARPSQSCLLTALQMGYLTGRREVAYANTEACLMFTRERGAWLPYGYPPPPPAYYRLPPGSPPNGEENGR